MTTNSELKDYFASCPKHLEQLLAEELGTIGAEDVRQTVAGVYFRANTEKLYQVCLWSRLANRILMPLARTSAKTADELYDTVKDVAWETHFPDGCRFVVDFIGTNDDIRNTQFGAQKVKDAIVDRYVELGLARPNVDKESPDVRINVRLAKANTVVSIDMSGESLHRRGYRAKQGVAPLKENLAAALLLRAGWPQLVDEARKHSQVVGIVDPMCGSGTILIEAALIASSTAPGLLRKHFGFEKLRSHDEALWEAVKKNAQEQRVTDQQSMPLFSGYDNDSRVLNHAKNNARFAGFSQLINFREQPLKELDGAEFDSCEKGVLICNPPYGERLGEVEALSEDYRDLGRLAKENFSGWTLAVFTSNPKLGREMRLRTKNKYQFLNGTIDAQLLVFDLLGKQVTLREDRDLSAAPLSEGAQMVANRIKKNKKRLDKWIRKENIECYRVYDADLPEYSAAIDVYGDRYHVQEYQAPKSIDERKAEKRFKEIIHATVHAFNASGDQLEAKTRARQKGKSQYEKLGDAIRPKFQQVREGAAKFNVNLSDYLDTGLFLDHRPLRRTIYNSAQGKRFLNLFCYTASATVQAALGGASESVSVDLSNTYLDWAEENFLLNNINQKRHRLERADCVQWLKDCRQGFDLIMLDPPSFSNSKNTPTILDIQKDHVSLITRCMELLNPGGTLYFSTNLRSFKLDPGVAEKYRTEDVSAQTLDPDFERNTKIHRCWRLEGSA